MKSQHLLGVPARLVWLAAALTLSGPPASAASKRLEAQPVDGADSYLELHYVPDARLTGDPGWDHLMAMNLFVPRDGKDRHPLVLLVHGGGYGGGDMNEGRGQHSPELVGVLLKRGYAVANLNYILTPAQIFPQVFWDFRTAVRFLRANAGKYRLDPGRVGAVGLSAGGWLVTSAGWTDAGDVATSGEGVIGLSELKSAGWSARSRCPVLLPMDEPDPPYAEQSARLNALSFDFSHGETRISTDDPAINVWGGVGFEPKWMAAARAVGLDVSVSELTDERFKGKGVHVPGFSSPALSADGKATVTLGERIVQFLDAQLVANPRAVAPEIRPNRRVFSGKLTVSLVAPPGSVVRYTTDGGEPTAQSPIYTGPFEIAADTTIKAVGMREGERPSGVASATFFRDPAQVPPTVAWPNARELPVAKVGQPYNLQFKAGGAGAKPYWALAGRLAPYKPQNQRDLVYPAGMTLDPATGELSGRPDAPGRYWVQVQVAAGERRLGGARNYLLVVEP